MQPNPWPSIPVRRDNFYHPPREYGILPFWFLNGELDAEEMRYQLREFRDKGMPGIILHGRYGLETAYSGETYLNRIHFAVEEAQKLGLQTWIYDEMNWPSGTADKRVLQARPDLAHRYIECINMTVRGPWFTYLTGADSRYLDFEKSTPVAAFAIRMDGSGEVIDLTPNLSFRDVIPWEAPATKLPLESLVIFEQEGLSEITLPCAACFNRFRAATRDLRRDPALKADLEQELGHTYHDSLQILSLLDLIEQRVGLPAVAGHVAKPLEGLRVVCYYGCLLTRPPGVTGAEAAEYPMQMDQLLRTLGATVLDWDRKVACCGASLSATNRDIVFELSGDILDDAIARGADAVAVACPVCHANLDGRQTQMEGRHPIPVLYFTQLMALAFGLPDKACALDRNLVDPRPVLERAGLSSASKIIFSLGSAFISFGGSKLGYKHQK